MPQKKKTNSKTPQKLITEAELLKLGFELEKEMRDRYRVSRFFVRPPWTVEFKYDVEFPDKPKAYDVIIYGHFSIASDMTLDSIRGITKL